MILNKCLSKSNNTILNCFEYHSPHTISEFVGVIRALNNNNINYSLISGGWNSYWRSSLYTCIVDQVNLSFIKETRKHIVFSMGVEINKFVSMISQYNKDVRRLQGIPGCLGGAITMNAGAFDSCITDYIEKLVLLTNGAVRCIHTRNLARGYRSLFLPPNSILLFAICSKVALTELPQVQSFYSIANARSFKDFRAQYLHYDVPNLGSSFKTVNIYAEISPNLSKTRIFNLQYRFLYKCISFASSILSIFDRKLPPSHPQISLLLAFIFHKPFLMLSPRLLFQIRRYNLSPHSVNMYLLNRNPDYFANYLSLLKSLNPQSLRPEICLK